MEDVKKERPDLIITSNPGCHLQMQLGVEREGMSGEITVKHLVEVVLRKPATSLDSRDRIS